MIKILIMKSRDKIKKASLLMMLLISNLGLMAQDSAAAVVASAPVAVSSAPAAAASASEISIPIYEQMGLSSTMLFIIMNVFTFVLLAVMMSMASSTKNILKFKDEERKKSSVPKMILALVGIFTSSSLMAAEPVAEVGSLIGFSDGVFWAYIMVDVVLIMFIIYFAGIVKGTVADEIEQRSLFRWRKLNQALTNAVPIENEASILIDHDYDGITELDNQLPPWWKYGFYITIVWAIGYLFYYQVFEIGNLQEAEYLAEMAAGDLQEAEYKKAHPELITAETAELLTDASSISAGKVTYDTYCTSCHMEGGRGGVGPNLTDKHWIYDNDIKGVFTTISEGAKNGMTAWKALLPADQIQEVASYVLQLEYVAPPEGKIPQGIEK
jgi:cytochrome c oxidase cbb3-type subunit 3